MKNNSKILMCSLAFLVLSACSTQKATNRTIRAKSSPIVEKTMIADVKVDLNKKLNGNATVHTGNVQDAKNLACWDAIEKGKVHAIVHPVYSIVISGFRGKLVSCTVTGYAGTYEKIQTASNEDLLNYIRVRLLTGTGILGISFNQFSGFYYSMVEGEDEEEILTEEELHVYYDEQVRLAKSLNRKF